jgi:hypothetical protein
VWGDRGIVDGRAHFGGIVDFVVDEVPDLGERAHFVGIVDFVVDETQI